MPERLAGRRLDAAVKTLFEASWNQARAWIRLGKISLGGVTITDGAHPVAAGDLLGHDAAARRLRTSNALPPDVLVFVDHHIVVADKPAGISTVPFEEREAGAMTSRIRALLGRRRASAGERHRGVPPPVLAVHRLDRDTSGLVVFARQQAAVEPLSAQFREHSVHRRYLALVHGYARATSYRSHLVEDRGDGRRGSLERIPPQRRKGKGPGRLAITHTEVVERFADATLVLCRLETGRTHQIRIHLAEAGHPLVGERVYVPRALVATLPDRIPAARMMLHAAELGFSHPITGAELRFERPPPADMQEVLASLRAACQTEDRPGDASSSRPRVATPHPDHGSHPPIAPTPGHSSGNPRGKEPTAPSAQRPAPGRSDRPGKARSNEHHEPPRVPSRKGPRKPSKSRQGR